MSEYQNKFKAAGIINIIFGVSLAGIFQGFGILEAILGILMLVYSSNTKEQCKNIKPLIIMTLIPMNIVSLILAAQGLTALDEELKNSYVPLHKVFEKKEPPIDPEIKKIDMLLKLGVFLVIISAILFATTSWNNITVTMKGLGLIIFGTLFLGLSEFTEKKLKLKKTSLVYAILGVSFYFFTWICSIYFELFGDYFTFEGPGKPLILSISCLLIAVLVLYIAKRFKKENYIYVTYTGILGFLIYLLYYLDITESLITVILTSALLVINVVVNKKTKLFKFSNVVSYFIWTLLFLEGTFQNELIFTLAMVINICNIEYLSNKTTKDQRLIGTIINYFLLICTSSALTNETLGSIIPAIVYPIYTLYINYNKKLNQSQKNTNFIIYTIFTFITALVFYDLEYNILLISSELLVLNFSEYFINKKDNFAVKSIQPISIGLFFYAVFNLLETLSYKVYVQDYFTLLTIIFVLFQVFLRVKDKKLANEYFYFSLSTFMIAIFMNLSKTNLTMCLFILFLSVYLLILYQKDKTKYRISTAILLYNIFTICDLINLFELPEVVNCLIIIISYIGLIFINKKDLKLKRVINLTLCLPLCILINRIDFYGDLNNILNNLYCFYLAYVALTLFVEDNELKSNILSVIYLIIALGSICYSGIIMGLYTAFLGIVFIVLGYKSKDENKYFIFGIIITVINILIRLSELWTMIPFWIYLLLAGLSLIGFVTYKELNKDNKK